MSMRLSSWCFYAYVKLHSFRQEVRQNILLVQGGGAGSGGIVSALESMSAMARRPELSIETNTNMVGCTLAIQELSSFMECGVIE